MKTAHLSHKGVEGTLRLARDNVFWPEMAKDITNFVNACKSCNKVQKDNPMEPIIIQRVPERPWSIVATDLFHLNGKDYILIADAYSGFFDFKELSNISSSMVIKCLKSWFSTFGIPDIVQSDGGKQYTSEEFKTFCTEWSFDHRISSPHFPRSNGLAERYVQEAKNLMKKCLQDGTDIQLALLHHRNTPRLDLGSPCQRLMNRRTKTLLPTNEKLLLPKIIRKVTKSLRTLKEKEKKQADKGKREIKTYKTGEDVLLRLEHNNWTPAMIVTPAEKPRSYIVETKDAGCKRYRRNAWHIKPDKSMHDADDKHIQSSTPTPSIVMPSHTEEEKPTAAPDVTPQATAKVPSPPKAPITQQTTRSGRPVIRPLRYQ